MNPSVKTQIIDSLKKQYGNIVSRKNIIQAILDTRVPIETYSHKKHRGLYSSALTLSRGHSSNGYLLRPGKEQRYFRKISKGIYKIID